MQNERCPQPSCREPTHGVYVEEGSPAGEVLLFPVKGLRWCLKHGLTEATTRGGLFGPAHIGPFVRAEIERRFANRGERVWRIAGPGEPTEMMNRSMSPPVFWRRVAFVRWDAEGRKVVPLGDLGSTYSVRPESVDRTNGTRVPTEIEPDLKRQDDLPRRNPSAK